ncbi:MAG: hypothetical protein AAB693_01885 [Patescibacteria group bacterium]
MKLLDFIKNKKSIFWSTKNYEKLSKEAVVEGVLNYGNMDDVSELISILGIKEMANIFKKESKKLRTNYRPEIKNYFTLYFKKYTSKKYLQNNNPIIN